MNANQAWQAALGQLQVEMPKGTFDTWVRDTEVLAYEDGSFVIGANNALARDWLEGRLKSTVTRLLTGMMNRTVEVSFKVKTGVLANSEEESSSESAEALPLESAMVQMSHAFDKIAEFSGNQMALAAAIEVAKKPGSFNPLFIYSEPGLGKTELLRAITAFSEARRENAVRVSAEEFTNAFTAALKSGNMEEFRSVYRGVDTLLVDDVHFLEGKKKTQEELINTINALKKSEKQVVFASNKPPKDLEIDEKLADRMAEGLVVRIDQPDFDGRLKILRLKAKDGDINFADSILEEIASANLPSIRLLVGAYTKLVAKVNLLGKDPSDQTLVQDVLHDVALSERESDPGELFTSVAEAFGVSVEGMLSQSRLQKYVLARNACMHLLRKRTNLSLSDIGSLLGDRDHTTVSHGLEAIEDLMAEDPLMEQKVEKLEKQFYGAVPVRV